MTIDHGDAGQRLRRAIRQELESLGRSGVTHWNTEITQLLPLLASPAVAPVEPTRIQAATGENPPRTGPNNTGPKNTGHPSGAQEIEMAKRATKTAAIQMAAPGSVGAAPPPKLLDLPLADRVKQLEKLQKCVAGCVKCPELARTRTQTVFGVGNPQAKIMFLGEAPGADEDATGVPFVGKAGQLLDGIIAACKLQREEIYICNILRCRPPGNRLPSPEEAGNCREWLDGQIAIVNPDYIICWGSTAAKNLLGTTEAIGKLRGQLFEYGRAKVCCTYHPSYLLRNPPAKKDVWQDMKWFFGTMGVELK